LLEITGNFGVFFLSKITTKKIFRKNESKSEKALDKQKKMMYHKNSVNFKRLFL